MLKRVDPSPREAAARALRAHIALSGIARLRNPRPSSPFIAPADAERMAADADPLAAAMMRLFLAGAALPREVAGRALGQDCVDLLILAGILTVRGEVVASPRRLAVIEGRPILAAPPPGHPGYAREGVPYCGPESVRFAAIVAQQGPCRRALDLCTGTGIIAMTAHAKDGVAVDIDPEALEVARFNLALNEADALSCAEGDLFAAVPGERFDRITANPPFLPDAPGGALPVCGAGGPDGTDTTRDILNGLADHLADGGEALIYTEGFGDHVAPNLLRQFDGPAAGLDIVCALDSKTSGARAAENLAAVWQSVGVSEAEAWAHWRNISSQMPVTHYYTMVLHAAAGSGRVEIRRAGKRA